VWVRDCKYRIFDRKVMLLIEGKLYYLIENTIELWGIILPEEKEPSFQPEPIPYPEPQPVPSPEPIPEPEPETEHKPGKKR
jgi:hypothetical protein